MCNPILATLLKMQPHCNQSSCENATPFSRTSSLASYKEVPPPRKWTPKQKFRYTWIFQPLKVHIQFHLVLFTVETNLSAVHLCIKSAMFTMIVPGKGVAETNFLSRLTTCKMTKLTSSNLVSIICMSTVGKKIYYCLYFPIPIISTVESIKLAWISAFITSRNHPYCMILDNGMFA